MKIEISFCAASFVKVLKGFLRGLNSASAPTDVHNRKAELTREKRIEQRVSIDCEGHQKN